MVRVTGLEEIQTQNTIFHIVSYKVKTRVFRCGGKHIYTHHFIGLRPKQDPKNETQIAYPVI